LRGGDFVCCDNPTATKFTIHILAAVAEHERDAISARTKAALAAVKANGKSLGTISASPGPSSAPPPRAPKPCEEPLSRPRTSRRALLPTRLTVAASRRRAASHGTRCRSIVPAIASAYDDRQASNLGVTIWPAARGDMTDSTARSPGTILSKYRLPDHPLYLVGIFARGVTVYSQQVRALPARKPPPHTQCAIGT
jgi:hypothetical protein